MLSSRFRSTKIQLKKRKNVVISGVSSDNPVRHISVKRKNKTFVDSAVSSYI